MTKALENWVRDALAERKENCCSKEAEFWIRTFSDDVERIAGQYCIHQTKSSCQSCRGEVFDELKRELLGKPRTRFGVRVSS
jgi:hypothetical protein